MFPFNLCNIKEAYEYNQKHSQQNIRHAFRENHFLIIFTISRMRETSIACSFTLNLLNKKKQLWKIKWNQRVDIPLLILWKKRHMCYLIMNTRLPPVRSSRIVGRIAFRCLILDGDVNANKEEASSFRPWNNMSLPAKSRRVETIFSQGRLSVAS